MQIPQNAAIYCRLSYAPDGSLEKVERQEDDCRRLADRLRWPAIADHHVFRDPARSAWQRNRKRPGWDALLAAIRDGEIDGVLVYHGDRLIRQPWDLELLLQLADDRRLSLASPSGTRDLSSEDDRFILRIEAAQACRASADTSRRVKRGWSARAKAGLPVSGGKRPFGYGVLTDRTGTTGKPIYDTGHLVQEEADVVAEAVERLLAGQSHGGVIAWMNQVSTTTQGGRWHSKNSKNVLTSPRIAGLLEYNGTLYDAAWPAIITREQWEDVKLLFSASAAEHGYHGRERRYLLSGVALCAGCLHSVRSKPTGGRNRKDSRIYYCWNRECTARVARNVEHLDRYVEGRVLRRLQDPDLIEEALGPEPGVAAEIADLKRRKQETKATLLTLVDTPNISAADVAEALSKFDARIAQLQSKAATSQRHRLLARMAGITQQQWDDTPVDVRSATVQALFEITILPATWRGPGFDPASVRLVPVSAE